MRHLEVITFTNHIIRLKIKTILIDINKVSGWKEPIGRHYQLKIKDATKQEIQERTPQPA